MPKSNKKQKQKAVDFAKAKLKLGKGKKPANNAVDTSFKARSITIPHQTIAEDKDASKPTTRRNLTLDELLLHLKHYNPTTRKDAIWGLRELFTAHPQLMKTSLTPVIQTCARIVGDEDTEVRKILLDFLGWFLRLFPLHQIRPHMPLLMLFITSAQTNIFPAIRVDAIRFLTMLLDIIPEVVIQDWNHPESTGGRVLDGYLSLLNAGSNFGNGQRNATTPSTSNVTLSPNSKLIVLSSLTAFIRNAISPSSLQLDSVLPTWYMASSFPSREQYLSFCSLLHPRHPISSANSIEDIKWSDALQAPGFEDFLGNFDWAWSFKTGHGFSLDELGDVGRAVDVLTASAALDSPPNSTLSRIAHLAHTLHPIMVSTWLDVAPAVFGIGASGSELEAQLAVSVARIAGSLYGVIFRDSDLAPDTRLVAFDDITALLGYMSTYLPCDSEDGTFSAGGLRQESSLAYCELTSLAMLASHFLLNKSSLKSLASTRSKQSRALDTQINRVGEYVIKVLNGELNSNSHPLGYSLPASAYISLLPTLWLLLNSQTTTDSSSIDVRIRLSCIDHALRTSYKSGTKVAATQFVGMLLLLHSQSEGPFKSSPGLTATELERFKEWYQHLPKVLSEVGVANPLLTETVLRILLRMTQRRAAVLDAETITSIRTSLVPYFAFTHPEKGEILGPFSKLLACPRLRKLALDFTALILEVQKADPLRTAVDSAVKGTEDARYWSALMA